MQATGPANAMTVDVEDYFQVQAFARDIARSDWDGIPCRVEANVERILEQFDRTGTHATFFTLGWIAERHPAMVRRIVAAGHELASHGFAHRRVDQQTQEEFRADVHRARGLLQDLGGVAVQGYRAPTFSINASNPWAFDVLQEEGHRYSSSIYPVRHDLYGMPDAPRLPFHPDGRALWEFPLTTVPVLGRNLPCGGGGYFRLLPYPVFRYGLRRFNLTEQAPGIFYFHPWEVDPGQPRVRTRLLSRFRHYVNLSAMSGRLDRLLRDFAWDRVDRVYGRLLDPTPPAGAAVSAVAVA